MGLSLSGINIAVVGGDERELVLVSELAKMGAIVSVVGFPVDMIDRHAHGLSSITEACNGAKVLILPVPGTDPNGIVRAVYAQEKLELTEKVISSLAPGAIIIIGQARPFLREWAEKFRFTLLEIIEMDEVAILNSIPTAEGAIQIAMTETKSTIHGSKCLVVGFGRVAITLARVLKSFGAEVIVVARNSGQKARAYEMGCKFANFEDLPNLMSNTDICFNTVPDMVLDNRVLKCANPDIVIIDLATQPGGTDFETANLLGLKAILAPGLPGKVAPLSAGKYLADVIPSLIMENQSGVERSSFSKNREVL